MQRKLRNKNQIDFDALFEGQFKKFITGRTLRVELKRRGWLKHACEACGQGETWNNMPLVLHLDHIDGDKFNNRKSNLRFLCPNCHTQTETFAGRNVVRKKQLGVGEKVDAPGSDPG